MNSKVVVIAASVVILAAVMVLIIRLTGGPPQPLKWPLVEVIDVGTDKIIEVPANKWRDDFKIDPRSGYKRDPQAPNRLYSFVLSCASCRAKIPHAPLAVGGNRYEVHKNYMCPVCHRPAYPPEEYDTKLR